VIEIFENFAAEDGRANEAMTGESPLPVGAGVVVFGEIFGGTVDVGPPELTGPKGPSAPRVGAVAANEAPENHDNPIIDRLVASPTKVAPRRRSRAKR
jgi:hypothetical protein